MNTSQRFFPCGLAAAMAMVLGGASAVEAHDVYLRAESFEKQIPNGAGTTPVTMWGYAECDSTYATCSAARSPGPEIVVPAGDATLTIHVRNALPEATSIVIPGQPTGMTPVKVADTEGRMRVQAFTQEVAAGADGSYSWNGLKPGTYLYQSGSHVQQQVQMGLYGAMVHDAECGSFSCAYPAVLYESQKVLVFSEVDPALHDPIPRPANLTKGGYAPRFFLINGEPYDGSLPPLLTVAPGSWTLLRLVNAGLENHAPQLLGGYYQIVGEDGNPTPAGVRRVQHTTLLPAAKSLDVIFTPGAAGTFSIFDRRLRLVNDTATGGGMLAKLEAGGAPVARPTAVADSYATSEDTPLHVPMYGVLTNDSPAPPAVQAMYGTRPGKGSLTLNADGSFDYTPNANASGADSFTYRAIDGTVLSDEALVTIDIAPVNDVPVALDDFYYVTMNSSSTVTSGAFIVAPPGVLQNDTDVDAAGPLTAANIGALQNAGGWTRPSAGADGSFTINIPSGNTYVGRAWFSYEASDGAATDPATASIVRDMRVTVAGGTASNRSPVFRDPSGAANDRWQIRGTIRAFPAPVTLTISLSGSGGGTVIGTVAVPAGATTWQFSQAANLPLVRPPTATGTINVTANVPATADGVPAHAASIVNVPYSTINQ